MEYLLTKSAFQIKAVDLGETQLLRQYNELFAFRRILS
jgi:hypothetical protein